jgi:hypothetical protein
MFRKIILPLLIVLALLAVAVTPAWAAKDYRAERFDVQFDLQPDGSALVTETVAFRFDGGPFIYAFRDIAATETDGVTFISAGMDGEAMRQGTNAGQVEVTGRDPLKVMWHFAPTSDTTHEFVVRYRVAGIVRKLEADTIRWRTIPQEHDYAIDRSSITLTYPETIRPIEPPTLDREFESSQIPNGYRLTTTAIPVDQDVIVTARFAVGTAAATAPQWQIQLQQLDAAAARALPIGLLAAVATLLLGGFGLFAYARAYRQEPIASPASPLDTPPDDLPPALVGKLTEHPQGYMGTLFDLAQRGVLEVHEDKGWWGSKKYTLELKDAAAPLSAHEQALLSAVFNPGETTVDMSAVSTRLASKHKACDEPLEQELIDRGWLDPERKRQRTTIGVTGFMLLLGTMVLFLVGMLGAGAGFATDVDQTPLWAAIIGIAAGGFVISIGLLIYYATFSPLTPAGEAEAARWKSFAKNLKQISKSQQPDLAADYFERYLPWAAAFGLGGAWAKHFQRAGVAPLPMWFHAMPGSDGDFGAIVAVMSASDSTGASAASGGAAGASGGGASGAG